MPAAWVPYRWLFPCIVMFCALGNYSVNNNPVDVYLCAAVGVLASDLGMQLFTNFDYPINVGGRPLYALSAFAVVAFELTVLFAALFPVIGMLALNGLPRLHHPVFSARTFARASKDRFFLGVLADDRKFDARDTARFLRMLNATSVELVVS